MSAYIEHLSSLLERSSRDPSPSQRLREMDRRRKAEERKVQCVETGKVFSNMSEAARAIGLKTSHSVREAVAYGGTAKGLHFKLLTKPLAAVRKSHLRPIEIDGKQYASQVEAAKEFGVHPSAVNNWLRRGRAFKPVTIRRIHVGANIEQLPTTAEDATDGTVAGGTMRKVG